MELRIGNRTFTFRMWHETPSMHKERMLRELKPLSSSWRTPWPDRNYPQDVETLYWNAGDDLQWQAQAGLPPTGGSSSTNGKIGRQP